MFSFIQNTSHWLERLKKYLFIFKERKTSTNKKTNQTFSLAMKQDLVGRVFLEPGVEVPSAGSSYPHQHLPRGHLQHTHTTRATHKLMWVGVEGDASLLQLLEGIGHMLLQTRVITIHRGRNCRLFAVGGNTRPSVLFLCKTTTTTLLTINNKNGGC